MLNYYDNISKLTDITLEDIYECKNSLSSEVSIVGPDKEYMLDTVAKRLDGREGNTVDGETAVNATSIQVSVKLGNNQLLFCGDCSFASIEEKVRDYNIVQLPHHGKAYQANAIFDKKSDQITHTYIVSDNTGDSNGGSDDLETKGHIVHNTKNSSNIVLTEPTLNSVNIKSGKSLGV